MTQGTNVSISIHVHGPESTLLKYVHMLEPIFASGDGSLWLFLSHKEPSPLAKLLTGWI